MRRLKASLVVLWLSSVGWAGPQHEAAARGDLEALRAFPVPQLNATDARGLTPLVLAIREGHPECVPLLLQLYFLYYALPKWGVRFSAYEAAVLGFILCSSAYHSEYIRGALLSIRQGQVKAAYSLGFGTMEMVLYVVIPQAVRRALPGCGNEIIYLIKYSSLAYVLTFIELTGQAKELTARSFHYIEIYFTAGMYYLVMTTLASWFLKWLEKKTYIPGFGVQK